MIVQTIPAPSPPPTLTPALLTRASFAGFGEVIANPRPEARPFNTSPSAIARGDLPFGAVSANQATAIQYRSIASMRNLYDEAQSGKSGTPRMTMFVCAARGGGGGAPVIVDSESSSGPSSSSSSSSSNSNSSRKQKTAVIPIQVLERHPFTTQTFIPLTADKTKAYLVIVAPSLPPGKLDEALPVPSSTTSSGSPRDIKLPGRGLPDLTRLTAFIATPGQAVTYGPGTWHAPMVALGPLNSTLDFVVVQFANDTPLEDCQEVTISGPTVVVTIPDTSKLARL